MTKTKWIGLIAAFFAGLMTIVLDYFFAPDNVIWKFCLFMFFFAVYKFLYRGISKKVGKKENIIPMGVGLEAFVKKDFVLYLRPFTSDAENEIYEVSLAHPIIFFITKLYTMEEQMTLPFKCAGLEVLSLSNPQLRVVTLGAKKVSIGQCEDWKRVTLDLLIRAKWICLNMVLPENFNSSDMRGFYWELETCFANPGYRKKLLLFIPGKKKQIERLSLLFSQWNMTNNLPIQVPESKNEYGGIVDFRNNSPNLTIFERTGFFSSSRLYVWAGIKNFIEHDLNIGHGRKLPVRFTTAIAANGFDIGLLVLTAFLFNQLKSGDNGTDNYWLLAILLVVGSGYIFSFSVGKRLLGIRVCDASGAPAQGTQLLSRQLLKLFIGATAFHVLLLYPFAPKFVRSWFRRHDSWTKTEKFSKSFP